MNLFSANPGATQQELKRKVLLLGSTPLNSHLAQELLSLGFSEVIQETSLLDSSQSNNTIRVDDLLNNFKKNHPLENVELWVHPGISNWAEKSELPITAQALDIQCLTPTAKTLSLFSNKLSFFNEAEKAKIPLLLLSPDPLTHRREVERFIEKHLLSPPFLIRSALGGGRYGIYTVHSTRGLSHEFDLWLEQLRNHVGETLLFIERSPDSARRMILPFARFHDGSIFYFPTVDGSLHTQHQTLVEICPAPGMDQSVIQKIQRWTQALANQIHYVGVGSFEFLIENDEAWLVDGSARLNTSFVLWEQQSNTHALHWQLATYLNEKPPLNLIPPPSSGEDSQSSQGFRIACRILAEDPLRQLPRPGVISELSIPQNSYTELSSLQIPKTISWKGQGLLALITAQGSSYSQSLNKMLKNLQELWIAGSLQTNERFLHETLTHPWIQEGWFHERYLDEEFIPQVQPSPELLQIFAMIGELLSPPHAVNSPPLKSRWAIGDRWAPDPSSPLQCDWVSSPKIWQLADSLALSGVLQIQKQHCPVHAFPISVNPHKWQIRIGHWTRLVRNVPLPATGKSSPQALALVAGQIHSLLFKAPTQIPAHTPFAIIESLGKLVPHAAPFEVTLKQWLVHPEEIVHQGQDLAEIEKNIS